MAVIISAFPGCGKTYAYNDLKSVIKVLDSDSSQFDKSMFPYNYVEYIKKEIPNYDLIFISSHEEVREFLNREGIDFDLFYPDKSRRNEFLENYIARHSNRELIMKIDNNWNKWIDEIEQNKLPHCHTHVLSKRGDFIENNGMIVAFVNQVLQERKKNGVNEEESIDSTELNIGDEVEYIQNGKKYKAKIIKKISDE